MILEMIIQISFGGELGEDLMPRDFDPILCPNYLFLLVLTGIYKLGVGLHFNLLEILQITNNYDPN